MTQEQVIKGSDFLSLNVSYSPATHHMIGAEELSFMKLTAYLVNASRGPLVDEQALLEALENKVIVGAALDVYEFEPQVTKGLEALNNVVLTPHIGNATVETRDAMAEIAAKNIIAVLKGDEPLNCVNQEYIKSKLNLAAK